MGLKAPDMCPQSTYAPTSALLHHPVRITIADTATRVRLLRLDHGIHTSSSRIRGFVSATTAAAAPAAIGCGSLSSKSRRIFLGICILAMSITRDSATDAAAPLAAGAVAATATTIGRRGR